VVELVAFGDVGPLISGGFKDVQVLAIIPEEPVIQRITADVGAAVFLAALGVVERLGSAVFLVAEVTFGIADRLPVVVLEEGA